ncbi:MAG: dienelactone hydrolase family protein [Rhodocyclaceae bacterium]|nr:dienelactone hydrolase family protein [Rhodocyclaceae bacterium]
MPDSPLPIRTTAEGLACGDVQIPSGPDRLPAFVARPAGQAARATILVVQEIFGVHEHIRDLCRRLAHAGYLAVAPELYFRQGDPRTIAEVPRLLSEIVARVPDAQVLAHLDTTAGWARGQCDGALGITGFCWGGRIVWLYAAHNPALRAGVAWYGRIRNGFHPGDTLQPIDVATRLTAPVLGLYGGLDQSIPVEDVEAMRALVTRGDPAGDVVLYPQAGHAFLADYRPMYQRAAAEDGWQRMLDWFATRGL